jgi:hypothetical protein
VRAQAQGLADDDDAVILRGGLGEKSTRWSQYAKLCVDGFGADDPRAVDAVQKAEQIAGAWEGQRTLVKAGLGEGDIAAMIFEHFSQTGGNSGRGDGSEEAGQEGGQLADAEAEAEEQGLRQAGTGRGLGFARRLRAALAEVDANKLDGDEGSEQEQEEGEEQEQSSVAAAASPPLSRTRSHRKRAGGAYGDHTRTGYVNTFSSVRSAHLSSFCVNARLVRLSSAADIQLFCCRPCVSRLCLLSTARSTSVGRTTRTSCYRWVTPIVATRAGDSSARRSVRSSRKARRWSSSGCSTRCTGGTRGRMRTLSGALATGSSSE